jgi:hypothetical protein
MPQIENLDEGIFGGGRDQKEASFRRKADQEGRSSCPEGA